MQKLKLTQFLKCLFTKQKQKRILQQYCHRIEEFRKISDEDERHSKLSQEMQNLSINLKKIKEEEDLQRIKSYILEGLEHQQKANGAQAKSNAGYIPNNLILKKLRFNSSKILLMGVEEEDEDHSIYVKRTCQKFGSKVILTALSPDLPYFIKTEESFALAWKKFLAHPLQAEKAKFYLNPSPRLLQEICLHSAQIELVKNSLNQSKQFNVIDYAILQYNKKIEKYIPNALLTPLLVGCAEKVYFCDYPIFKEREMWAMSIPLGKLRQLFQNYKSQIKEKRNSFYDPRIQFPSSVLVKKFKYIANQIKLASLSSQQTLVFICPAEYAQIFCKQWEVDAPLEGVADFSYDARLDSITFLQFVQKLVILDTILEPVISKYFIKNNSFPFTGVETVGGKEHLGKIFILWKHFQNIYNEALEKSN